MFFYHFLQLCPQGHISKMLTVTVIKNTVNKRLWNFQIRFLPYLNMFEIKIFTQTHLNKAGNGFENSKGAYYRFF